MHMLTRPDCDCAFNFSKSQYAEDLIMLPTLLHARRGSPGHGVFVELGALDGIAFSNTYILERCFGWRGLLIEGNPASFAKLRESGRASTFLHSAVCGASDPPFVEFTVDGGPVAGQVGQLTRGHQHKWGWWNRKKGVANVSCAPLSTLLHQSEHFGMAAELPRSTCSRSTWRAPKRSCSARSRRSQESRRWWSSSTAPTAPRTKKRGS